MKSKTRLVLILLHLRPFVVFVWSLTPAFLSKVVWSLFRHSSSKVAFGLRYLCVHRLSKQCGEKVIIFPSVFIYNVDQLSLGTNITIHEFTYIDAYGGVTINNHVAISHNVSILAFDHIIPPNGVQKIKDSGSITKPVIIGENVWIGCGCRVLKGSSIPNHSVLGAGSVLTKRLVKSGIYIGTPVRLIKEHSDEK